MNVREICTEGVNWVSMAPDGVQLTNDGQFNELQDIMFNFFFFFCRDKFEEWSTNATNFRGNSRILINTNK